MDLVLWRHAEAHDAPAGGSDLARALTPKGIKQAMRVASWLNAHLPEDTRICCSPARRTVQTVEHLARAYQLEPSVAPDASPLALRALVGWPGQGGTTLVVGHQPTLGQVVAQLMGLQAAECSIKKGAVWWLRHRLRDGVGQTVLVAVHNPDWS
ncbi:MAG: histidine phosphatase family protein [Burkholderiaceae bacterium]|nr:histidine phosphatase family protein [Burkholderiaceae bacterium]MDP3131772.1 histidine phosphatase family protein [Burkholderiaceae bacterium]MDP3422329.1 histidine phosphatase family protein [Burkholderiaceae bacterium]MDZ4161213.1 histidine phosphatase family protein [Burkholderiales bacterium]